MNTGLCFLVTLIWNGLHTASCIYNPLTTVDSDCFVNITLEESAEMVLKYDEDDNVMNLIKTERFDELDGQYLSNKRCGWFFWSNNGTGLITLNFEFFELEESKRCSSYDYVRVYRRGKGQEDWEDITTREDGYCGRLSPFTIETYADNMYIEFVADSSKTGHGFNVTYYLTFPLGPPSITCLGRVGDETCDHNIVVNEREGISLECQVKASPKAGVEWRKVTAEGNAPIRKEFVRSISDDGTIELYDATLADEGIYKCMAKNKHALEEQTFNITVIEKCRCPKSIKLGWYNYPPYTQFIEGFDRKQKPIFKGIFYDILEKMLPAVCGQCTRGHGASEIVWSTVDNRQKSLLEVKQQIETDKYDIILPILNVKDSTEYRGKFFLPLFDAPGLSFLVPKDDAGGKAIFSGLWSTAPVLGLTVLMVLLAGIIIWMLDAYWNEDEFPRTVLGGIIEGAWWAYITMTTVGYGDIAPRGYLGRAFAVVWIMAGLVIISILTGAISTALTVASMKPPLPLYGAKLGAIKHTEEFKLGVTRNAEMTGYDTFSDILSAIDKGDLQGALVDQYVTGYYTELHELAFNSIVEQKDMKYGIVIGGNINEGYVHRKFLEYVDQEDFKIEMAIVNNIGDTPEPATFDLMNYKGKMYITSVITLLAMLVVFVAAGVAFDYGYKQPKRREIKEAKNLEMIESKRVKDMAQTSQIMKDSLIGDMRRFYHNFTDRLENLERAHEHEKTYFDSQHRYIHDETEMSYKYDRPQSTNSRTSFKNHETTA